MIRKLEMNEAELAKIGRMCQAGEDVAFVLGLDGTRWAVQAINFTAGAWPGAPEDEYVLIVLAEGAYSGHAYPFGWHNPVLHAGYLGSKLWIARERDQNDLTRILAAFLGREPAYVGNEDMQRCTREAEFGEDVTVVWRRDVERPKTCVICEEPLARREVWKGKGWAHYSCVAKEEAV